MVKINELREKLIKEGKLDPKKIWYNKNKERLRQFESTDLFKSYRNLRTFIQKRKSKLNPDDLVVLEQIRNQLKNVIQEEQVKSRFQFNLKKELERRRCNTGK